MANKQRKQNHTCIVVSLRHVATPDADARLSRTVDILLKAAAKKNTPKSKEMPRDQKQRQHGEAPEEDALTHGNGGSGSNGEGQDKLSRENVNRR